MNIEELNAKISSEELEQRITDNYDLKGPFKYKDIYLTKETKKAVQSNYSSIKDYKYNKGLYLFTDLLDNIIYVGEASKQTIYKRITNHFSCIQGSLMLKIDHDEILETQFYLLISKAEKPSSRQILFDEALLIGLFKPKFNF